MSFKAVIAIIQTNGDRRVKERSRAFFFPVKRLKPRINQVQMYLVYQATRGHVCPGKRYRYVWSHTYICTEGSYVQSTPEVT